MTRADPQFKLRVPSDLKERIEKSAAENHRSMNAEIVARLQSSYDQAPDFGDLSLEAIQHGDVAQLFDQLRKLEELMVRYAKKRGEEPPER